MYLGGLRFWVLIIGGGWLYYIFLRVGFGGLIVVWGLFGFNALFCLFDLALTVCFWFGFVFFVGLV